MADKETKLSIVIRAIDQATAPIRGVMARIAAANGPLRASFGAVGSALKDVLGKLLAIGGVIGGAIAGATAAVFKLVDGFDALGDKAESIGVSVDFLAQMRYAAERSGASVEQLDSGLQAFSKSLGQARAGTGRMTGFLKKVSPELLKQLKAAKSNQAAFDILAGAMARLEDPAKKAALAQATLGDATLAPLFSKGPAGIKALRDRYLELAGSQEDAAKKAGEVDDAMKDFKAATDGIKAALVSGLAPALKIIVDRIREWFQGNRENVKLWATQLGEKLPAAFNTLVGAVKSAISFVRPFVDSATKLKVIAGVLAGVIVGPLVASIYTLGAAILATPVGWILAGIAAIAAGAYLLIDNWDAVSAFFVELWTSVGGKFAWARRAIMVVLGPVIGAATLVIAAWEPIKEFFVGLWDGVTAVFQKAWDIISGIVDKVRGAVDFVTNSISSAKEFLGLGGPKAIAPKIDLSETASEIVGVKSSSTAKVTVDFANAPRGTRVRSDPQSTANVDLSVGYQMIPGMP